MRALRNAITVIIGLAAVALVFGIVWPTCSVFRSFSRLEQNVKRRITAPQLQSWATNLLVERPPGPTRVAALGTNFPQQLLGLYRHPPNIMIYESRTNDSGSIQPGWVRLTWGGGLIGHRGFEIGPTNFSGYKKGDAWSDGVYFWRD